MKRLLHYFFLTLLSTGAYAQEYTVLQIASGYNADVIANGIGSSAVSTTIGVDNANFAYITADFQSTGTTAVTPNGLPVSGLFTSAANAAVQFQMGPYSGNNSLRFVAQNEGGTLTFSNQLNVSKLYLMVTSGSGNATVTGTLNFSDNTTQAITASTIPDWYNSTTLPVAISGIGRVNRANNVIDNPSGNPRIYQMTINVLPANQSKLLTGVTLTKTSTAEGVVNVFGASAEIIPTCPSPTALVATTTATGATVSWTGPATAPAGGYDYYYAQSSTAPTTTTVPTGNVTVNTVTFSELATGQLYYFWVRSNCSTTDKGIWKPITFTTGQLTTTYTGADISTDKVTTNTITSPTTCPGVLTVNVPAGYQIVSTATNYSMQTASDGYMSEQRSLLVCNTTGLSEGTLASGAGSSGGTYQYSRSNLNIANGATGAVVFELRAWRTYGGSGCNVTYNKVVTGTWKVTITYALLPCTTPAAPTAVAQSFCSPATVSNLQATGTTGSTLRWYATAEGGTALAPTAALTTGNYYVSQQVQTCESTRTAVAVTVTTVSTPIVASQIFCQQGTVAGLVANGTAGATFNWYADATNVTALSGTTALSTGTYYVSEQIGTCESSRVAVEIIVSNVPVPVATAQTVCVGATLSELSVTGLDGAVYNWYPTATGTGVLALTTPLATGTYYVSQQLGDCESVLLPVQVTINVVAVPQGAATQQFLPGATVAGLTVTTTAGATVQWYLLNESSDLVPVALTTALQDGVTYYVTQSVSGCESAPYGVTAVQTLGTGDFSEATVHLYPNPVATVLNISSIVVIKDVRIYNAIGQLVLQQSGTATATTIDVSGLAAGQYNVVLKNESGAQKAFRIIKK